MNTDGKSLILKTDRNDKNIYLNLSGHDERLHLISSKKGSIWPIFAGMRASVVAVIICCFELQES